MTGYLVHDANGAAVSVGTVLADPLPEGLTAVKLNAADYDAVINGRKVWDGSKLVATTRDIDDAEAADRRQRLDAARTKAKAIIANPAAPDWTAAERKTLLAALVLGSERSTGD